MRVGIIGLQHESNTFQPQATTWEHFEQGALLAGRDIHREYGAAHHEIGGFFQGLDEEGIQAVPVFFAWAMPGGPVSARTLDRLLQAMLDQLKIAGQLDGVLVAPHGAAVSENRLDMDGAWLRELRSRVGPQIPIVGTLDLHANLSQEMLHATDALIGYRTNPHLDQRQRGQEAARLIARMLRGEAHPTPAAVTPPMAINIERQNTSTSPVSECFEALDDMLADHRVLSNSLLLGFPYADVPEMGASAIVVTNDDPDLARQLADEFAEYLRLRRGDFVGRLVEVDAAIDEAAKTRGPVCLLDMGDNVGGGSPGDGTMLLHALVRRGVQKAFVSLFDPDSVQRAVRAGVGRHVELEMGGHSDAQHGKPLVARLHVRGLYDGSFSESQPRHGGRVHYDMGPTVVGVLEGGQTVMLTSRRVTPFSLQQLTSCGINPEQFQMIVAKGVHAPVAAYQPVCRTMLRVNTPGVTTADMTRLAYNRRRRPMFPFERD
jgi:microcystin degradation protein MlrC